MQKFMISLPVVCAFGVFSVAAQSTNFDVQKGQKYRVETATKLVSTAEVMGQSMENSSDSKSTTVYEILGVGKDGISLRSTITKMQVNTSAMGQEMTFDSDKKDNTGPMADAFSKILNQNKEITLDNKGAIIKQDAIENDIQEVMLGVGGGNQAATELFIPALAGKAFNAGDSYPETGAVKKEKFSSVDSGMYKITAVENGIASVSYTGTQVISAVMEQMGMEMTSNSNNVVKSELQVDVKSGIVLAKATVVESSVSIDAAGMTIPATGKSVTTVKITAVQ